MKKVDNISYQHFMLSEFNGRKARNSSYSLRAFARDLDIAAPKLSEILRGLGGISETSARKLVVKLGLEGVEAETFINLVILKHGRRSQERMEAAVKLRELKEQLDFNELSLETFKIIADWWHFAILELTEVEGFESDITWIAKRLKIPKKETRAAIDRLLDFGLLAERPNGSWYQTEVVLSTPSGIPSTAIRNHHRQILSKASDAILDVPITERDFSATTMSVSEQDLKEVNAMIKKFRRDLAKKLSQAPKKR